MPKINGIEYPRVHEGVVINGPEDWPAGIPAEMRADPLPEVVRGEPVRFLLNNGQASELTNIKGVGRKTANDIIASRESEGPFTSFQDCAARVGGVSVEMLEAHAEA